MIELSSEGRAIVEGRHSDPFHYLGRHRENDRQVVRAYLPEASEVRVIDELGGETALTRIHDAGLFLGDLPAGADASGVTDEDIRAACLQTVEATDLAVQHGAIATVAARAAIALARHRNA